jgi:hypothetical protein
MGSPATTLVEASGGARAAKLRSAGGCWPPTHGLAVECAATGARAAGLRLPRADGALTDSGGNALPQRFVGFSLQAWARRFLPFAGPQLLKQTATVTSLRRVHPTYLILVIAAVAILDNMLINQRELYSPNDYG